MHIPSITSILGFVFLAYICHSMYIMSQLFMNLQCTSKPCYRSLLDTKPKLQLAVFTSLVSNPMSYEVTKVLSLKNFNYWQMFQQNIEIDVPLKTRRNGSLFLQVVLASEGESIEWKTLKRDGPTVIYTLSLTEYMIPRAETFNLLRDSKTIQTKTGSFYQSTSSNAKPVSHLVSKAYVTLLTDSISLSHQDVPPELARLIHVNKHHQILPIVKSDYFNTRLDDLVQITKNTTEFNVTFIYKPIGIGKLRLMLMIEHAMSLVQAMGFTKKDIDEVKGIFSDTNVYLLCGTVFVGSIHMLFDFLSLKNDVIFWRRKKTYEGLSTRTTLWRAFSQIVIFLYLLDENTSLLVLIPCGLGMLIELWKCKKILKLDISLFYSRKSKENGEKLEKLLIPGEKETEEFDRQGMKYLSYLLYPLCVGGAIYSLLYQPHKSWYSWTLNSLVNGVYAFGFLFMLPQLFVNYKLKSVAALPWRSFMYKAFNTFIDDFFAFIITMPTAHRVACLRDDLVFLIYLYQRWLYPVDKSRIDNGLSIEENNETEELKINNEKEKKEK